VPTGTEAPGTEPAGPLAGLRVIDLTTTFMGPYCTLLLARMGADVVKVEAPGGDIVRHIGPERHPGMGTIFLNTNHGKRSIALDLKHPEGAALLRRLLADADVFVTNMRPHAVAELRLGFDELHGLNPRLVHCTLTGFGSAGPYRELAAYDDVIQGVSGLAATQGEPGPPEYVRSPIADKIVGLMGLSGILAALTARSRSGLGQAVEVPMFESMAEFMLLDQQGGHVFEPPIGPTGYPRTSSPYRKPYRTADGYLSVVVYTDRQWLGFFELIGRAELLTDERFRTINARTKHIDQLYQLIEQTLPARGNAEWLAELEALGIPCVPVLTTAELFDDEHLKAVEFFETVAHPSEGALTLPRLPITFSSDRTGPVRPAPRLGEHGPELLRDLGLTEDEVRRLTDARVLLIPDQEA
jgi:crotonobetainyl-CoA:carnitine CoA-transferase CaiB-like acyl-CoA transferase